MPSLPQYLTAVVGLIGAAIAALVYRLNAHKLFIEMMDKRRDALDGYRLAAEERHREITEIRDDIALLSEMPKLKAYWSARDRLKLLYGTEVAAAADKVEADLRAFAQALHDLRDADEAEQGAGIDFGSIRRRYNETAYQPYASLSVLSERAAPYINLGHRGLGVIARVRLWYNYQRRERYQP